MGTELLKGIHTGNRTLQGIDCFLDIMGVVKRQPMTISDIIKETGYSRSSISRYLKLMGRRWPNRLRSIPLVVDNCTHKVDHWYLD